MCTYYTACHVETHILTLYMSMLLFITENENKSVMLYGTFYPATPDTAGDDALTPAALAVNVSTSSCFHSFAVRVTFNGSCTQP